MEMRLESDRYLDRTMTTLRIAQSVGRLRHCLFYLVPSVFPVAFGFGGAEDICASKEESGPLGGGLQARKQARKQARQ
jgi:hypothetical protein